MTPPQDEAKYRRIYSQVDGFVQQRNSLYDLQNSLVQGARLTEQQQALLTAAQAQAPTFQAAGVTIGGGGGPAAAVTAYVNYLDKQIEGGVEQLYSIDPSLSAAQFPEYLASNADTIKARQSVFGGGGAAPTYQFQITKRGQIIRTGSNGSFEIIGTDESLADKQTTTVTNKQTGEVFAVTLDSDGNEVNRKSLGVLAFPEVDPREKFRFDVLTSAAQVEASLADIELQQRGQLIKVIGDDFANQIALGNMVYSEANLNLSRVNTALTQRRAERELSLKYGVMASSIRTNAAGEQVTRLPFSSQLAGILSQATGQSFSPTDFELGVGYVSPDQAASDVMQSSSYQSPIAGLAAGLQSTRDALNGILGKPLGTMAASKAVTDIAAGVK